MHISSLFPSSLHLEKQKGKTTSLRMCMADEIKFNETNRQLAKENHVTRQQKKRISTVHPVVVVMVTIVR